MVANPFWAPGEPSWLTDAHNLGFVTGTRSAKTHIAKRARLKHLDFKFDLVVTAGRVGAYKPETPSRFLYARVTWRSGNDDVVVQRVLGVCVRQSGCLQATPHVILTSLRNLLHQSFLSVLRRRAFRRTKRNNSIGTTIATGILPQETKSHCRQH